MTNLTIKFPIGGSSSERKILATFCKMYPAFYIHSINEITLTKAIFNKKYKNHICDIIDHEYQHAIIAKLEGKETSKKLDNLIQEMLEWLQ